MKSSIGIAIVRTNAANLASVSAAMMRLNLPSRIVESPSELTQSDALVVPGVGSFATGIAALRNAGWDQVLVHRFEKDEPTLAICLGFQLLCQSSAEDPTSHGLGILPGTVERLPSNVTVPQFGWNKMESDSSFFSDGFVYYANSYCVQDIQPLMRNGWQVATTKHGVRFVAAARKDTWLTCQFHPELSGVFGQRLLRRWADGADRRIGEINSVEGATRC